MYTIDKIKYHVPSQVISTIDQAVKNGRIEILQKWLESCKQEIELRKTLNKNTYPLFYEKAYLEHLLPLAGYNSTKRRLGK
jgi:hypothetical protein